MIDIGGMNALVTGSSRGIGQQIALGLAREGCNVILHGRTEKSCAATVKLLEEYEVSTWVVWGELSEEGQVQALVEQVRALDLDVDILYNNAAVMADHQADFWHHDWKEWDRIFRVNVMALYDLCGAFMPGMIERGFGRVVNLSSGIKDMPELAPYGVSKWAVNKLSDDLAVKLPDTGVRINTLDPGWLKTDMGGANAEHVVEAVLPGAIDPALIDDDGPNGDFYSAIARKWQERNLGGL